MQRNNLYVYAIFLLLLSFSISLDIMFLHGYNACKFHQVIMYAWLETMTSFGWFILNITYNLAWFWWMPEMKVVACALWSGYYFIHWHMVCSDSRYLLQFLFLLLVYSKFCWRIAWHTTLFKIICILFLNIFEWIPASWAIRNNLVFLVMSVQFCVLTSELYNVGW
jgi:hypothetical protein